LWLGDKQAAKGAKGWSVRICQLFLIAEWGCTKINKIVKTTTLRWRQERETVCKTFCWANVPVMHQTAGPEGNKEHDTLADDVA